MAKKRSGRRYGWLITLALFIALTAVAIYVGYLLSGFLFDYFYWRDEDVYGPIKSPNTAAPGQDEPPANNPPVGDDPPPTEDFPPVEDPPPVVDPPAPVDPTPVDPTPVGPTPDPDQTTDEGTIPPPDAGQDGVLDVTIELNAFVYYHIQVGSFSNREVAVALVDNLATEGIGANIHVVTLNGSTFYRVVAAAYTNVDVVQQTVGKLQDLGHEAFAMTNSMPQTTKSLTISEDAEDKSHLLLQPIHKMESLLTLWTHAQATGQQYNAMLAQWATTFAITATELENMLGDSHLLVQLQTSLEGLASNLQQGTDITHVGTQQLLWRAVGEYSRLRNQ